MGEHKSKSKPRTRMTLRDKIRANAEFVISGLRDATDLGENFGYNRDSIEFIEGFIERMKERGAPQPQIESQVQMLGSFLGEAIIHNFGGEWREFEGQPGVFFENGSAAFPFNKVAMQFKEGMEQSILLFWDVLPKVKQGLEIPEGSSEDEVIIYEAGEPKRTPGGHRVK
jgi:hypothetical protein